MGYSTKFDDPTKGIETILNSINKFDKDRFLYALQYKHYNQPQLELMTQQVVEYRIKLEKEHERLLEFAKTFNHVFVTDNNQCFDTALKILRKLRSGIKEVKRIYMKFCPRWSSKRIPYKVDANKHYSAFDYSYFSIETFQLSFFELEDYPPHVQGLYNELCKFFFQLHLSLVLCIEVMKDEEKIRHDKGYCNFLFEEYKEKVLKEIMDIVMLIPPDSSCFQEEYNPAIASLKKFSSTEAWAPHGFHNFTKDEVKFLIIKEVQEEEKRGILTKQEILLFGNKPDKVKEINNIILHFDDLMPDDYSRKKLDSLTIAMFMKWCGVKNEHCFLNYFNEKYANNPNRLYGVVTIGAVNNAKKKLLYNDEVYNDFLVRMNQQHYMSSSTKNFAG